MTAPALPSYSGGTSTEFPMTLTGEIRKVEMRQASVEELGLASAHGFA